MEHKVGDTFKEWNILYNIFIKNNNYYFNITKLAHEININRTDPKFCYILKELIKEEIITINKLNHYNLTSVNINLKKLENYMRKREPFKIFGNFVERTVDFHNY